METRWFKREAPIKKGQAMGEIIVYSDGVERAKIPLIAAESVKKATLFDCIQDVAKDWNAR